MTEAIILAAGAGTRMANVTDTPKALVPVAGKTMLEWQLNAIDGTGIGKTVVICNQQNLLAIARCCEGRAVAIVGDPALKSAGNVANWLRYSPHPTLVMYCDVLTDANLLELLEAHDRWDGDHVTCLFYLVPDPWNRSHAVLDGERVVSFVEKPPRGNGKPGLAWAGVLVVAPPLLDDFEVADFGRDCIPAWVERGVCYGVTLSDNRYLIDVGDPENYARAQREWRG